MSIFVTVHTRADSFSGCSPDNSGGYLEFRYKPRNHHEGHEDHEGKRMNLSFFVFFVLFVVKSGGKRCVGWCVNGYKKIKLEDGHHV